MSGTVVVGAAASVVDSLPRSRERAAMDVNFAAAVMAVAVLAAAVPGSSAQNIPACASKLVGCAQYINTKETPPQTCCGPLKEAAASDLVCLCGLFNNTALLQTFQINATKAVEMGKRCGISTDQSACAKATSPSPSGSPSAPSTSTNATGSSAGGHDNSAYEVNSIGLPGLVSLLFSFLALIGYLM